MGTPLAPLTLGASTTIAVPVILAPMSGVTDLPFRRIVKAAGHRRSSSPR